MWLIEPFNEKITFKRLFGYWLIFLISGIALKELLTPLFPAFIETEEQIVANFCQPIIILEVGTAFLFETLIFFVLPYKFKKKKGAIVGVSIWVILHLLTKNIPIMLYIALMGYFYYRCLEIGKWKEIMLFHFIPNFLAILSCI